MLRSIMRTYPNRFALCLVFLLTLCPLLSAAPMSKKNPFSNGFYVGGSIGAGALHSATCVSKADFSGIPNAANPIRTTLNNGDLTTTSISASVHGGFFYNIEETEWAIALEPYIGTSPLKKEYNKTHINVDNTGSDVKATQRYEQKFHFGLPLKLGYVYKHFWIYGLAGIEAGRFEFTDTLLDIDGGDSESNKTKRLVAGVAYGLGVEMEHKSLRFGLEIKNVTYARESYRNTLTTAFPTTISTMRVKPNVATASLRASFVF